MVILLWIPSGHRQVTVISAGRCRRRTAEAGQSLCSRAYRTWTRFEPTSPGSHFSSLGTADRIVGKPARAPQPASAPAGAVPGGVQGRSPSLALTLHLGQ